MNILVTGQPKSGKSTTLHGVVSELSKSWGFITYELREGEGRVGFKLKADDDTEALLAHVDIETSIMVGKFHVALEPFEDFMGQLRPFTEGEYLYIDEIGQIQLGSPDFVKLLYRCLDAPNHLFGSISSVFDSPIIDDVIARQDTVVVSINGENREQVRKCLLTIARRISDVEYFNDDAREYIYQLTREYVRNNQLISLYKLYANAFGYVLSGSVSSKGGQFIVRGKTDVHVLSDSKTGLMVCDCPLSCGKPPFKSPSACSHMQAVKISQLNDSLL